MANFESIPRGHYGAILADPPWHFQTWGEGSKRNVTSKYTTMQAPDIAALPVAELAAPDCVLFMWIVWPKLFEAIEVINGWGFTYKTCAFAWIKGNASQMDMFREDMDSRMGMGFWTRANSEVCLLATRGTPKRLSAGVRQGIIEPTREHSRKPDCVHERIERLVAGPYLELFARAPRIGWDVWGNETSKFAGKVHGPREELPLVQPDVPHPEAAAPELAAESGSLADPEVSGRQGNGDSLCPMQQNQGSDDSPGLDLVPPAPSALLAKLRSKLHAVVHPRIAAGDIGE